MGMLGEFISKGVTGGAGPGPSRVSSLSHKSRDNPVERGVIWFQLEALAGFSRCCPAYTVLIPDISWELAACLGIKP